LAGDGNDVSTFDLNEPEPLRRVELRLHIAGEPVAFDQDLVDFMDLPLAESRRLAGAQW
jgi:hypothetical protein